METFNLSKENNGAYRWSSIDNPNHYGRRFIIGYGYKGGFEQLKKHIRTIYKLKKARWIIYQ